MSHVCLQFGQCGNQLGYELYSVLSEDMNSSVTGVTERDNVEYCNQVYNKWFKECTTGKLLARAVLIDTERKVIKCIRKMTSVNRYWDYSIDNSIMESTGGAANNWALGYKVKGPDICDQTIDLVRKECERCDRLESIITLGSTAGGTGSGVGSYIVEQLRNELPSKYLVSVLVLPYKAGEVVTQNFNTLFSLSKLYDNSDAIFMMENDELHSITSKQLEIKDIVFADLNRVIAEQIASVFQPVGNYLNVTDNILNLTAHSLYKILTIRTSPFVPVSNKVFEAVPNWEHLKRTIIKTLRLPLVSGNLRIGRTTFYNDHARDYSKSVGNLMFYRGLNADGESQTMHDGNFDMNKLYTNWIPKKTRCMFFNQSRKFIGKDKYATLVTNNALIWSVLDNFVAKGWDTYIHNAYLHQYSRYGVEQDDFLEMFLKMEKIVKCYKDL